MRLEVITLSDDHRLNYELGESASFWKAKFDILDPSGKIILKIVGPCCLIDDAYLPTHNEFSVTLIFLFSFII